MCMLDSYRLRQVHNFLGDSVSQLNEYEFSGSKLGLLSGVAGVPVCLAEYMRNYHNKSCVNLLYKSIEYLYDNINNIPSGSLCDGYAGVNWMLRMIDSTSFIDSSNEIDLILRESDVLTLMSFNNYLENNNLDYLHGAVGIGYYFLQNGIFQDYVSTQLLLKFHSLEEIVALDKSRWLIPTYVEPYNKQNVYNLGLAHGMASYQVILNNIYTLTGNIDALQLLKQNINYYISILNSDLSINSAFPYWMPTNSYDSIKGSKLAWCYGDLGIGLVLLHNSILLKDSTLYSLSLRVLLNTTLRLDLCDVIDNSLCHGTAWLIYSYAYLYKLTGIKEFHNTCIYWLDYLLSQDRDKICHQGDISILSGQSGIILSLLYLLSNYEPSWPQILAVNLNKNRT